MLTWLLPFALTLTPFLGCDDGETATVDAIAGGDSEPIGRDMRPGPMADAEVDMAPSEADISIEPRALTLLADPGGASAPGLITIRNVGGLPLSISRVAVEGEGSPFAVVDGPVGPVVLAGGESLVVAVVFTPGGEELVMGALTVVSDDPDESPLSLPLTGRIRESCLRAMPSTVNVGEVAPGGESPRFSVRVVNCGDRAVEIGEVALAGDEGFDFVIEQGSANATLAAGGTLGLAVWYRNTALPVGEVAATVLSVGTDLVSGALAVNVSARGGSGPSCVVTVAPVMVDFETLRLGATREVELVVGNAGSADCEVRSLGVEPTAGPVENEFRVARGIEGGVLRAGSEVTIAVVYAPMVPNPLGDRAELRLSYHDPVLDQNRRETALLRGVAAEALIGGDPAMVAFGEVSVGCASWVREVRAANVGFVPICVSGFRYEGEGCGQFVAVEEPEFGGECTALVRDEAVVFSWRYQPAAASAAGCTLVVESDAQNAAELSIALGGTGTDETAVVDEREVGALNRAQAAYFNLARPAVEDSLRLFVEGRESNNFGFSEQRNALVFRANNHPAREGEMIRIEYDAVCFDLVEPE